MYSHIVFVCLGVLSMLEYPNVLEQYNYMDNVDNIIVRS